MRIKKYTYWDSLTPLQRQGLASKLDRSPDYLRLVFKGNKSASPELALQMQIATGGAVKRGDLRPDIYPGESCGEFQLSATAVERG